LFFYFTTQLTTVPIRGLNLNFLRNDDQKLEHYDQIIAKLQKNRLSKIFKRQIRPKLNIVSSTAQDTNKILRRIVAKILKIDKLKLLSINPTDAEEFVRLLVDSIALVIHYVTIVHRKYCYSKRSIHSSK
jgi:hypothetical protein